MWFELAWGVVAALAFLWIPGYLIARGMRLQSELAFACAPVISVALYAVLSIVYGVIHVPCGWVTLPLPLIMIGLLFFARSRRRACGYSLCFVGEANEPQSSKGILSHLTAVRLGMILALVTAVATALAVYVTSLGSPDNFIQYYDNAFHLSRIQSFVNTRNFSSLRGSFYPSAWHMVAALAQTTTGTTAPIAQHIANLAFIIGVYPSGIVALMATLFPHKRRVVWLSGIFCLAVAFWPWRIMLFGPLYPNLATFCMMPLVAAVFISFFYPKMGSKLGTKAALFVLGGIALALAQPNGIFSTAVFLIPFCLYQVRTRVKAYFGDKPHAGAFSILAEVGLALTFLALWLGLTQVPAMHDIVYYPREPMMRLGTALEWGFNFSYVLWRPQFAMELAVLLGTIAALIDSRHRWLVLSYLIAVFLYVVSVSVRSSIKYLICGFFYSDFHRLAAVASIFAVPLICLGIDAVIEASESYAVLIGQKLEKSPAGSMKVGLCVAAAVVACVMVFNYVALGFVDWYWRCYGFDAVQFEMRDAYNNDEIHPLDLSERAFLKKVKPLVGNSCVANVSYDGSAYAYATDDIDVMFSLFGLDPDEDSQIIRRGLNRIATDPDVKAAAQREGVKYVLQLDEGCKNGSFSKDASINLMTYQKVEWNGIMQINEATPGFELVLSEGDMRLYRITALD